MVVFKSKELVQKAYNQNPEIFKTMMGVKTEK